MTHNGSYWFDSLDEQIVQASLKPLPAEVDVVIIGGGYTGLWSAYYLSVLSPDLKVAVLEAETVGVGASGRNGGWCMGMAHGIEPLLARPQSQASGVQLMRAMQATVDEIGQVTTALGIDCHFKKGGNLTVATQAFQVAQLQTEIQHLHQVGFSEQDYTWLPAAESQQRVNLHQNYGALYTPHCAAIHPARLVRGLAKVLSARGVDCLASTRVLEFKPGAVVTDRGTVWGLSPSPIGNSQSQGSGTGTFTQLVIGLPTDTLVYYRAYATNSAGTAYSANGSFTLTATTTPIGSRVLKASRFIDAAFLPMGISSPCSLRMTSTQFFKPSIARATSIFESGNGLPPSRAASIASSSKRDCIILAEFSRTLMRCSALSQFCRLLNKLCAVFNAVSTADESPVSIVAMCAPS